jgi:hypothetical protein
METDTRDPVVVISHGLDHEMSSAALIIAGASVMHERIKGGAATLSF